MPNPITLLDTNHRADAGFCGFDRACDPYEDGEGLILIREDDGWFTLTGPDGSVQLPPQAAQEVGRALLGVNRASRAA